MLYRIMDTTDKAVAGRFQAAYLEAFLASQSKKQLKE